MRHLLSEAKDACTMNASLVVILAQDASGSVAQGEGATQGGQEAGQDVAGEGQVATVQERSGNPIPKEARAWTMVGVLGMVIGGLVLLMVMTAVVMVLKRKRRLEALKQETDKRRAMDPWAEAGRRAETPTAEELEG
jgi:hypothetical protein